ncbi:hypothetical protein DYB37_000875 [Aphanomyces astaci]|uniref:Secreted protein n=1 Tax=Aphanomyces astaci TaxID=112090 RepID=A0A397C6T4_APHAT|nr:hypothetical protein AaE_004680 [Aphanomyces astaci]RHY39284.1 hypothetical protein DYB38_001429 [Aphanomyces astaci]RHY40143.1 hypothetical protein DYB30_012147 [Aphanomyces astaci]RHY65476.1 hypothetical protein DYB34_006771 [Aphanomyces astaci]RHY83065.1 hypothetical protein DYB35_000693 [Aphanomyces astaci]
MKVIVMTAVGAAAFVNAQVANQPPVLPQTLSALVDTYKPIIATFAATALPATVGNCSAANAPLPCTNIGNLFNTTSSLYTIEARWISGLNTLSVDKLALTSDANGTITIDGAVSFKSLPLSLKIEACLPGVGCNKIADDTSTCCGTSKTVAVTVTTTCSEVYPYLRNLTITQAKILPSLDIMLNVSGKSTKVFDATTTVESELKKQGSTILASQGATLVNEQLKNLYGDRVFCTAEAQKKWLDANPPASQEPAATPVPRASRPPTPSSASLLDVAGTVIVLTLCALLYE